MHNGDKSQDALPARAQAVLKPPTTVVAMELAGALAAGVGAFFLVMSGSTAVVGGWDGAVGAVGAVGVMFALLWLTGRLDKRTFTLVVTSDVVVVEDWRRRKAQFTHSDWVEGSPSLRSFVQRAFGAPFIWNARACQPPLLHFTHPPMPIQARTFVSHLWYGRPSDSWPVLDDVVTALAALPEATRRQVTLSSLLVVARALKDDASAFDRSRPFSAQHVHEVEAWAMVDADKQTGASGPTWIFEVKAGRCVGVWMQRAAGVRDMFDAPRHRLDGSEVYAVPTQLDKPERGRALLLPRLEQLKVLRRAELACEP